ncbi:MAG TPA: F0F1 ATP synthase subunit delta [Actinomycetes bacterium]|nr:F0F1 ATP synthase subunit delta [Actinomycetes bacterium]
MPLSKPALAQHAERLLGEGAGRHRLDQVADELAAFARLVASETRLRAPLVDPGLPTEARRGLLDDLGRGQLEPATVELLATLVERQRTAPRQLPDLLAELAAQASFAAADAAGDLDRVEDDLFRFGALVERTPDLRAALTDPALPLERKRALVGDLVSGKAHPRSVALLELLLDLGQGRELDRRCRELAELAATRRNRVVAQVRTAVPLDGERQTRLASTLADVIGKPVELRCTVDASIMGSVVVRVGDEVFDGSIRSRIEQARERLGVA